MKTNYYLFAVLFLVSIFESLSAQSWSYAKQGTLIWQGAIAKDIYTDDVSIVAVGDIGLIDIMEGEVYMVYFDTAGTVHWEQHHDKAGSIEISQHISPVPSDGGYLVSAILGDTYKPWFIKTDGNGNLLWSSDAWSDLLPENSASQTYVYQLPSGDIACINSYDVAGLIYINTVSNATGDLLSTTILDYHDLIYPDYTYIFLNSSDIEGDGEGNFLLTWRYTCTDTTVSYIARINSAFVVERAEKLADVDDVFYPTNIAVNNDGDYLVTGISYAGGFFGDQYTSTIVTVPVVAGPATIIPTPGALFNSNSGDIKQLKTGDYKYIRYNYDGETYDPATGGYVEIVTLDISLAETSTQTINYTDYNTLEAISTYGCGDKFIAGGMAWKIGIPSYYFLIASDIAGNIPACVFNCVWPGDADNDGFAFMDDLFAIGLGYGATGAARPDATNYWTAQNADEWATTLPDGTNHKYTDANGDGIISDDDTTAVSLNYTFSHAVNILRTEAGDIPLSFITDGSATIGLNTIPIVLGDAANMVDAIYGIRFNVAVDGEDIEPGSIKINFNDSWLLDADNYLQLTKNNGTDPNADGGAVRTDNTNASGYGEIGTLSFVVIDNIAGKGEAEEIEYRFENIRAINLEGEELSIVGISSTETNPTGINELNNITFIISPNPTSNYFYLQTNSSIENISIFNITGNKLKEIKNAISELNYIDVNELSAGQYLVEVIADGNVSTQKLMIIK